MVWAPILPFNPVRIPTPSPGGALLPTRVQTTPNSPQMMTHSAPEARAMGTRKCLMPTNSKANSKASMIPLIPDQPPVRPKRECRRVTTRWRLVTVKNLRSPKSLKSLIRSSFKAFRLYLRPCQRLMGPLALRYRLSSGKAWQKPLLKTGLSCGEPPGPYVAG